MIRMKFVWTAALVLMAATAGAQTQITATSGVEFNLSADHDALNADGTAVTDHYDLEIVTNSNGALFFTQALGKPAGAPGGPVTVKPIASFSTLTRGVLYKAAVVAVGSPSCASPCIGRSVETDPFVLPLPASTAPAAPAGKPRVVP